MIEKLNERIIEANKASRIALSAWSDVEKEANAIIDALPDGAERRQALICLANAMYQKKQLGK